MYEGCTRNAYHLYMLRYDSAQFADLPREKFLQAVHAEGIPITSGYQPLNKESFLKNTLESRAYQAIYPSKRITEYFEHNLCPENDRLCETGCWIYQTTLRGPRSDMDQIAEAVRKVQKHAAKLAQA